MIVNKFQLCFYDGLTFIIGCRVNNEYYAHDF